jgi:hypothetical protein
MLSFSNGAGPGNRPGGVKGSNQQLLEEFRAHQLKLAEGL